MIEGGLSLEQTPGKNDSSPMLLDRSSREFGGQHSSTKLVDIELRPSNILDWVQIKAKVVDNKVVMGNGNTAINEYILQITQSLDENSDKGTIRIVQSKEDEGKITQSSRYSTFVWKIRINVRDLFQAIMFFCPKFTEEDIPDPLWQEAEYGIK